jgi:HTH-type transcriptional regulator, transcriptional repressor of NAD biosynthesis genes
MNKTRNKLKLGLTLGKFAPFHIGHQYLLDTALREVDKLIIVMYNCPNLTQIPLNVRASWVRKLYPQVEVIEGWDAPNRHEDTPEVKRLQEQYISRILKGRKITHFISSEYYGDHMSKFLNAVNLIIDMDRVKYPISSTMIREKFQLYRRFIPSLVLKDLISNVVILGAPSESSEKIVCEVASRAKTQGVPDLIVHYLSDSIFNHAFPKLDLKIIAKKRLDQRLEETVIQNANKSIIYSSSPLMDHILSIAVNRKYDGQLYEIAKKDMQTYDLVFINSDENNLISKIYGIENSFLLNQLIGNLDALRVKYILLEGDFNYKVQTIIKEVNANIQSKGLL